MLTVSEIRQKLTPVFDKNGVTKATLFGSYAANLATEHSDIDLVIDTEDHIKGLRFFGILDEIKKVLNQDVDLLVQRMIEENSVIDQEIKKEGVIIYEKTD